MVKDAFLDDQYKQLDRIVKTYKRDMATIHKMIVTWPVGLEEPGEAEKLSAAIKLAIKSKATFELSLGKWTWNDNYVAAFTFEPIRVKWPIIRKEV